MFLTLLVITTLTAKPPAPKQANLPVPVMVKEPKLDGDFKDLSPSIDFKMPESAEGSSASIKLKSAFRKDTLYLGLSIADDIVIDADQLEVSLYFPDSGTTSRGFVYRFGKDGVRSPSVEAGPPPFAAKLVKAAVKSDAQGWSLEVALPLRALPRFQANKPLAISICADYADLDSPAGEAVKLTTCPSGDMLGGPTRLPEELRKNLKLAPPANVEGIEAREGGFVGFSRLHWPTWAQADAALTPEALGQLIAGAAAIEPSAVASALPRELKLADNRPLFTVLTGKNPFVKDRCDAANELRMQFFLVKNTVAISVLEWPAVTCALGRAMRFDLGEEGTLVIGYTNGATQHFVWSDDHFERSELGVVLPTSSFQRSTM